MNNTVQRCASALLLAALGLAGLWAPAQAATKPATAAAKPTTAAAKAASVPKAEEPSPGFTITPMPNWVKAQAAEPGPALPTAPVHVLLIDRQTRVDPAGTVRYQHLLRQVNSAAGLQKGGQIELEFDPSYQKLQWHRLEVWREGKRIDKLERKAIKLLHREPLLERQMIDGRMTASVVLDDLRVGDRVEWAASLVGDNPVFGAKYVDQEWTSASSGPVALVQVRLLAPAGRVIAHRVALPGIEINEQVQDGWRETVFRRKGVPQFHADPMTPAAEFYKDQIELSEFSNWAEVAGWADGLFAKAASGLDALEPQLAAIRAAASTPQERLRLALDFVQQEIRYFGTESGIGSHQPAPADQVLRQRFGDCKDKAALLSNLLARLDIAASPVLVSTHHRQQLQKRLPSPLAFDHVILRVQLEGKSLWLDATRNQQRGAPDSRQSYGFDRGLLARADSRELAVLPSSREALRSETVDVLTFGKLSEPGRLLSTTTFHGDMAEMLREARSALPEEELAKTLMLEILRVYPSFTQEQPPRLEEVEGLNALKVSLSFSTGDYWRLHEKRGLVGDFAMTSLIVPLRLQDQTPRTQPLLIPMPGRYLQTLRYEFADEIFAPQPLSRFDESNEHFVLQLRSQGTSRHSQMDGELRLQADAIAAGQWTRYRDQLAKVLPRMGGAVTVPLLSNEQLDGLRKEVLQLVEAIKRGMYKINSEQQVAARASILTYDRMLAAGRLPAKARAEIMLERAQQLDSLGHDRAAWEGLLQALELAPDSAELNAALAVNALRRRDDAEAVSYADRSLQLASGQALPRYVRASARFFAGDWVRAREDLQGLLQLGSEDEKGYGGLWLYLVSRHQGEDGVAATQALLPEVANADWPLAMLKHLQGKLDLSGALAIAKEKPGLRLRRECELYFYAAQKALLDKDLSKARSYLRKSVDTAMPEIVEFALAQRELARLGG